MEEKIVVSYIVKVTVVRTLNCLSIAYPKMRLKLLKTKGLCNPNPFNVVCSAHFPGGKKTYENNIQSLLETNKSIKNKHGSY